MGESDAYPAVAVAEENPVVWDNAMTQTSPMNRGAEDVPFQRVRQVKCPGHDPATSAPNSCTPLAFLLQYASLQGPYALTFRPYRRFSVLFPVTYHAGLTPPPL